MKFFQTEEQADVAITLSNMATIYYSLGQIDTALEINQKVLSIGCVWVLACCTK